MISTVSWHSGIQLPETKNLQVGMKNKEKMYKHYLETGEIVDSIIDKI